MSDEKLILVLSIGYHPWGLPVSCAVVVSGTTKPGHLTASLASLHSPHTPMELKPSSCFTEALLYRREAEAPLLVS